MKLRLPYHACDVLVSCTVTKPTEVAARVLAANGVDVIAERLQVVTPEKPLFVIKLPFCNGGTIETKANGPANINITQRYLKAYDIPKNKSQQDFIDTVIYLCAKMNSTELPKNKLLESELGHKFEIKDQILSANGKWLNTPCLVWSGTKEIWLDQQFMQRMTINERIAAMCHEWGHIHGNPSSGVPKKDEPGADINGMILFCSFGFGPTDYFRSFKKTFKSTKTPENQHREILLHKVAKAMQNGKIYQPIYKF